LNQTEGCFTREELAAGFLGGEPGGKTCDAARPLSGVIELALGE
jgi:hypothetical protein